MKYFLAYSPTMRCLPGGLLGKLRLKKVVVHCRGGLGNQLFQASAGYFVAKELNASLSISLFNIANHDADKLVDISNLEILRGYSAPRTLRGRLYSKVILRLNWIFPAFDLGSIGSFPLGQYDRVFRTFRTIHLSGYFADFTYGCRSNLFNGDVSPIRPSEWFREMVSKLQSQPVVAIHVRRGDFLTNPEHYGILDATYYQRAIATIPSELHGSQMWVFSDSPSLAQETLSEIPECQFVYILPPPSANALESLILMSLAQGHIVANSTFSFWAALISKESKFVCYPARDKNGHPISEGIPHDWIQVEESWN
jgi:hypothetical protein